MLFVSVLCEGFVVLCASCASCVVLWCANTLPCRARACGAPRVACVVCVWCVLLVLRVVCCVNCARCVLRVACCQLFLRAKSGCDSLRSARISSIVCGGSAASIVGCCPPGRARPSPHQSMLPFVQSNLSIILSRSRLSRRGPLANCDNHRTRM